MPSAPHPLPAAQEYVPENLESLTGFDPPPSPPTRCAPSPAAASSARLLASHLHCRLASPVRGCTL